MKKYLFLFFLAPFSIKAQEGSGIYFRESLSWQQIKERAKSEGKYILVDCFTTWCGPCKLMNDSVYPTKRVGDYINDRFICMKFQMDTTSRDRDETREKYADARMIAEKYHIAAFPSLIFLSPEGEFVFKAIGYKAPDALIDLSRKALNPQWQYFNLMNEYKHGLLPDTMSSYLIQQSLNLGDSSMAFAIARTCVHKDLGRLKSGKFLNKKIIDFIVRCGQFGYLSLHDANMVFNLFNRDSVDFKQITGDTPKRFLEFLVAKEEIDPYILAASKAGSTSPNWVIIENSIKRHFNYIYAVKVTLMAESRWYEWKRNWPEFCRCTVKLLNNYGLEISDLDLNAYSWKIFQHSGNTEELNEAIQWIGKVLERTPDLPNVLDTYANLLYKEGKKSDAIAEEKKATCLAPESKGIQENFTKMQKGQPTW